MKTIYLFFDMLCVGCLLSIGAHAQTWNSSGCDALSPEVLLTMIDACGAGTNSEEPSSEYFMFQTNSTPFDANTGIGVQVECPQGTINADYSGAVSNPVAVADLNALVGSCATPVFIDAMSPPTNGIIPPDAVVWAFNTDQPNLSFFDPATFATLCGAYPIYVTFGTYSGTQPMFKNQGSCTACGCIRYVTLTLGSCTYSYSYNIQELVDENGDNDSQDGAFISFNDDQTINYGNNEASCFPIAEFCTVPDNPIVATPAVSICANDPLPTFVCNNCNDATLWFDQAVGGISIADGAVFTPLSANSSSFWVQNIGNGCASERIEVTFTVTPPPSAIFNSGIVALCQGQGTVFSVPSPQAGVQYIWTLTMPDNSSSVVSNDITYEFWGNIVGNYTITQTASVGSCSDSYSQNFSVAPQPPNSISPIPAQYCEGQTATLSYNGTPNDPTTQYLWQISNATTGEMNELLDDATIDLANLATGSYTVLMQYYSPSLCESLPATVNFEVSSGFVATATAECFSPSAFEVTLNIAGGTAPYNINGANIVGNTATYTYPDNTNYVFMIADNSNCPAQMVDGSLSCDCPPIIAPQLNTYLAESCANVPFPPFVVQNPQAGYSYIWYNEGGIVPLANNSLSFQPTQSGNYFVIAVNVDECPSQNVAFTVSILPIPADPPTIDNTYCLTDPIGTLYTAPSNSQVVWDCTNCADDGQGSAFAPSLNGSGSYQYQLSTQNQEGCQSNTTTANITLQDCSVVCPSISDIVAPSNLCSGETANLLVNINDPEGTLDHIAWFDAVGNLLSSGANLQTTAQVLGCTPLIESYVAQVFCTANPANPSDTETTQVTFHPAASGTISVFNAGCAITATPVCPSFTVSPAAPITTTIDGDNSSHSFTIQNPEAAALGLTCATTEISGNLDCSQQCFQVFILANGNVETCHATIPNLFPIQGAIFVSDPATFAGINWFEDAALSIPISSNTFMHSNNNLCANETRTIYAGALCSENLNAPIYAGTVQVTIFPPFTPSFMVATQGVCGVVPTLSTTCSNYIVSPNNASIPSSVDPGDNGNAMWFVRYNDGPNNNSCFNQVYSVPYQCEGVCPQVNVTQTAPSMACSGEQFTLAAQVSPPSAVLGVDYSIQWLRNGVPIPGANQLVYNATAVSGTCDTTEVVYSLGYSCIIPGQLTETYPAGITETPPTYNANNIVTNNPNCQVPTITSLCGAYLINPINVPNTVGQGSNGTATWQITTSDNCFSENVSVSYTCPLSCPSITAPLNATTKICASTTLSAAQLSNWTNGINYTNAANANGFEWFADAAFTQALTPAAYTHTNFCAAQIFTVYVALRCVDNSLIPAGSLQITSYPSPNSVVPVGGCSLEVQSACGNGLVIEYQTSPNTWSSTPPANPTTGQSIVWQSYVSGADIDNDGTPNCVASNTVTATACECTPPAPATGVVTNLSVCEGSTNTATFSVSVPANAFAVWYDSNGNTLATGSTFVPTQIGTYSVQTFAAVDSCAGGSITATLSQTPLPNANFSYPQTNYCSSNNTITPAVTNAGGAFSANNGLSINPNTGEISLTAAGDYTITYTVGTTCVSSSTQSISIAATPTLPNLANPNLSICPDENNATAWTLNVPAGFNTNWYNANNQVVSNQSSFTATAIGAYSYQIINANNADCVSSEGNATLSNYSLDNAAISYPITHFCIGNGLVLPTISGTQGGEFSANGIDIDPVTGAFAPNIAGDFVIYYTTNGNCPAIDSISVSISDTPLSIEAGADTSLCLGDTLALLATLTGSGAVSWSGEHLSSTNTVASTFTATEAGEFVVSIIAQNECQTADDSLRITVFAPSILSITGNTSIVSGDSTQLSVSGGNNYTWQPITDLSCADCANTTAAPTATITYTVSTDLPCSEPASITIEVTDPPIPPVEPPLYVMLLPNAFSPNGDDRNDELKPTSSESVFDYYYFMVYDRWGQLLFETNEPMASWDGTYKGRSAAVGVYVYYLEYAFVGKAREIVKGNVTLIR
ncbi:MAG: gliding motility-associated C-terminal domain-containing protein [Chitinophagales bacterium]|nr:gliding motility-associated C-terminal domain-containing protein [Chitinophagales bacterium]